MNACNTQVIEGFQILAFFGLLLGFFAFVFWLAMR